MQVETLGSYIVTAFWSSDYDRTV